VGGDCDELLVISSSRALRKLVADDAARATSDSVACEATPQAAVLRTAHVALA
jgi:hypothetical protein